MFQIFIPSLACSDETKFLCEPIWLRKEVEIIQNFIV